MFKGYVFGVPAIDTQFFLAMIKSRKILKLAEQAGYVRIENSAATGTPDITLDLQKLIGDAAERGLLGVMSGLPVSAVEKMKSRAGKLLQAQERAHELLRKEFGAVARFQRNKRFQPNGKKISREWPEAHFYWKRARIAVLITGPRIDDFSSSTEKKRNDSLQFLQERGNAPFPDDITVLPIPYYVVTKQPRQFLEQVHEALSASGAYPRLKEGVAAS